MELKEIFARIKSGEISAHSELGTRDESLQSRNFSSRIQKLKTVTGINAHALAIKDMVLPFNPFTGKADLVYNQKTPFRPILLVSQTIEMLKLACKEDKAVAKVWEELLGTKFSDTAEATMEDYHLFKDAGYIKPRVTTYHTVALNFGPILGFSEYKNKYTVDPAGLNMDKSYDYESAPIWHKAAIFFNSIIKPEADAEVSALEKAGANKEAIQAQKRAIYAKSPVGFVGPTNLIPFIYIPFGEAPKELSKDDPVAFEQYIKYYSYTDKWTSAFAEAEANPMFDEHIDFYDFTIKTPSSKERKPNGQVYTNEDAVELYAAMTITNTDGRLTITSGKTKGTDKKEVPNTIFYQSLLNSFKDYFAYSQEQSAIEGGDTFEKIMAASNKFRPITAVLENFLGACNEVYMASFANSKYLTEAIKKSNHDFLTSMNASNELALAEYSEDELQSAEAESLASVGDLIADAKEMNLPDDDSRALDLT